MLLKVPALSCQNAVTLSYAWGKKSINLAVALPSEARDLLRGFMLYLESSSLVPGDPPIDLESALHS